MAIDGTLSSASSTYLSLNLPKFQGTIANADSALRLLHDKLVDWTTVTTLFQVYYDTTAVTPFLNTLVFWPSYVSACLSNF
jgi:hypothetical protein